MSGGFEGSAAAGGLARSTTAQSAAIAAGGETLEMTVQGAGCGVDEFAHDVGSLPFKAAI
jgi:hypothetical protein